MLIWRPEVNKPLAPDGPFAVCYDLVQASNATRYQIIVDTLQHLGLEPVAIPVSEEPLPNVLVRFHPQGPYILFVAHYDKSRETPTYQGASDNTASLGVLLAVAHDLVAQTPARAVALLFTSAEERGLKGAHAFHAWAQEHDLTIAEVVNLDMLGRDRLAIRPSALPGFYFRLPLLGELVYDGRRLRRGKSYRLPDPDLVRRLTALMGLDIVIYQRFTAYSDSNVFQEAGLPTVTISSDNMYYLDLVWERDLDRVEWLDKRNLALARQLIVSFAGA
jgi:Zn-dependent M28 family amino/carboxypeptidase